jgi:formiminoglutamate deiminase
MSSWWCEHAWVPPGGVASRVLVACDQGRIISVATDADPLPDSVLLPGFVLPGLANVHSHAFHRALRARTQRDRGDFWLWRDQMYQLADRIDPESYLVLARAVYAEMALAGITCVGEFHYLHHGPGGRPYDDPNIMAHALVQAAADVGIRLTLLDACYLHGEFDLALRGAQQRFGDGDAEQWAHRVDRLHDSAFARVGAAIHSVRAVAPEEMRVVAKVAADRSMPLHVHLSEQIAENERCMAKYGRTPTRVLADVGALRPGTVAVHATHLTDHDALLLASSASGACLCPTTERDLADGIGRASEWVRNGVVLSLGSDSHAVIDMFEEARGIELDERLATHRRGQLAAPVLLDAATINGHRSLGWVDAGALAPGMRADLVAVDLDSPRTAGCGASAETIVFAASAADVTDVVIDGRPVVRHRQHVAVPDVGGALRAAIAVLQP